jgi:hypothetical protein
LAAAEKVARYRHAQLSAVRLAKREGPRAALSLEVRLLVDQAATTLLGAVGFVEGYDGLIVAEAAGRWLSLLGVPKK